MSPTYVAPHLATVATGNSLACVNRRVFDINGIQVRRKSLRNLFAIYTKEDKGRLPPGSAFAKWKLLLEECRVPPASIAENARASFSELAQPLLENASPYVSQLKAGKVVLGTGISLLVGGTISAICGFAMHIAGEIMAWFFGIVVGFIGGAIIKNCSRENINKYMGQLADVLRGMKSIGQTSNATSPEPLRTPTPSASGKLGLEM